MTITEAERTVISRHPRDLPEVLHASELDLRYLDARGAIEEARRAERCGDSGAVQEALRRALA